METNAYYGWNYQEKFELRMSRSVDDIEVECAV